MATVPSATFTHTAEEIDAAVDAVADKASQADLEALAEAVEGKQDALTFDSTPTANSDNPVKSKGIKSYVDAETTARQAECNVLANAGAKNLCPYNTASVAVANRAAIDDQPINLSAGTYIISYTQTATSGSSSIKFSYNGTSVVTFPISNDSTPEKEAEFTLPSAANQIKIFTNVVNSYSNIMIRRKEISDATYQPYAPTNRELYEMILALQ